MQKVNWETCKHIHFVGIGGIGVSAAARIVNQLGIKVTGSELAKSLVTQSLMKEKIQIVLGPHEASSLGKHSDLVVHSNAVQKSNPELVKAQAQKIPTMSYPKFLSELMGSYLPLIVTGTHGKSTTTTMLAHIFIEAGLDPTVVVGANINAFDGNARVGLGRHFIAEGDEYRKAFLNYNPVGLIVNNIEADHLDYYKTEEAIVQAFRTFVQRMPRGGYVAANIMDSNVIRAVEGAPCKVISYGIGYGDLHVTNIINKNGGTTFSVSGVDKFDCTIRVPGVHNVLNALAACTLSYVFGISVEYIQRGLMNYDGTSRRFEIKGTKKGITIIDDYAHHPTAIRATLRTAKEYYAGRKIWCIFQPHTTHRTESLFSNFVDSFTDCERLIIVPTYRVAGREKKASKTDQTLVKEISKKKKDVVFANNFKEAQDLYLKTKARGDVVITMGAGSITELSDLLLTSLT